MDSEAAGGIPMLCGGAGTVLIEVVTPQPRIIMIDGNSYIVIATKDLDLQALEKVITSQAAYIGMIGSRRKAALIREELMAKGVAADRIGLYPRSVPKGRRPQFCLFPPIKGPASREALWEGLRRGDIRTVATDHCPFPSCEKDGGMDDFTLIPNGCMGMKILILTC